MPIPFEPEKATTEKKKEFAPLPDGKYFTHIIEYGEPKEDIKTKKGAVCDVLKLTLEINGEKHPEFGGRRIWSDVWITKSVNGKDPSSSDNTRFYKFLEAINYPLDQEEAEVEGVTKTCTMLPQGHKEIFSEHIEDKPIVVTTYTDHWQDKEGNDRTSAKVKYYEEWKGGKPAVDDDLPF